MSRPAAYSSGFRVSQGTVKYRCMLRGDKTREANKAENKIPET